MSSSSGPYGGESGPLVPKPRYKGSEPLFSNPNKQSTCSLSPTRVDAAVPTSAPTDTARSARTPNRPHRQRGPGERVSTPVACSACALCRPTPHARGCGGHGARATGDACARKGGGGERRVPAGGRVLSRACASRAFSLRCSARRVPSPPGARTSRPRAGLFGLLEPHITRSFCQGRRLRRGSSAAAQPQLLGAASLSSSHSSATPCPFPALLSHRESLDSKLTGLRRGLEKWRCRAWIMPSTAPPAPVKR